MAFIRKRTTENGVASTALVEAYRDGGKPKHRTIANLHGCSTLAEALGRLAAMRDALRKERAELAPHIEWAQEWMAGEDELIEVELGRERRKEAERHIRHAKQLLKRVAAIDAKLEAVQRDGVAISKHCKSTKDEIRAEAAKHTKKMRDKQVFELGLKMMVADQRDRFKRGKLRMP
jgi:hypothetical protein